MSYRNLAEMIEERAGEEPILSAVIGNLDGCYDEAAQSWQRSLSPIVGKVLAWQAARPLLDRKIDTDFGGTDGPPVYAWTATRVLFVAEYDGSQYIAHVPRNPCGCVPVFSGSDE